MTQTIKSQLFLDILKYEMAAINDYEKHYGGSLISAATITRFLKDMDGLHVIGKEPVPYKKKLNNHKRNEFISVALIYDNFHRSSFHASLSVRLFLVLCILK